MNKNPGIAQSSALAQDMTMLANAINNNAKQMAENITDSKIIDAGQRPSSAHRKNLGAHPQTTSGATSAPVQPVNITTNIWINMSN